MKNCYTRGFSLIETIVSIGLFTVLLFVLMNLYVGYGTLYLHNETQFNTANDTRAALRSITPLVLQAYRVLPDHAFGATTYATDTSTLILQLPAIGAGGSVISNVWDYVAVYQTSSSLYRQLESDAASSRVGGTKLIASTIQSITFTLDNASTTLAKNVTVTLQAKQQKGHVTATNNLTAQIRLRNY